MGNCTFCRAVSDENSAPCWNRMPHRRSIGAELLLARFSRSVPKSFDAAAPPGQQADDRAHQHRLAAARAADHAQNFAPVDVERKPL